MKHLLFHLYECFLPRRCVCCKQFLLEGEKELCSSCMTALPLFRYSSFTENELVRRIWNFTDAQRAVSLLYFVAQHPSHEIFMKLKFQGRADVALQMGRLLASVFSPGLFFEGIDYLIPVPLHPKRLKQRGYNQAEQLAKGISAQTSIPLLCNVLCRVRDTRKQTDLNVLSRFENVQGAFGVGEAGSQIGFLSLLGRKKTISIPDLNQKHVLLVDDVVTTGATVSAAAQALYSAFPNVRVSVVCLGTTIRNH
ncbi:MAG: ComF family protein [Bacteroidales bacterium]|nr:ComF family protein [Candidatus Physcousia equi]